MKKGNAILVTTEFRGVFFGYLEKWDAETRTAVLKGARNIVYWSSDVQGFLGLAASGPSNGCRVGPKVDGLELQKVTARVPLTDTAVKRFEEITWK